MRWFFILNLLLISRVSSNATSCYFPDGTFAEFDSPCFPNQAESICCGQGHTCMSNNLCRWPDSQMGYPLAYIRGSCTDPTWNSAQCGDVCKSVFPSQWDPIVACPAAEFCCEIDGNNPSSCCNLSNTTTNPIYQLGAASTMTVIGTGSTPTASASVSISTVTTTANPSSMPSGDVIGGNSAPHKDIGKWIGIGVGVGGGLLAITIGVLIFLCLRRRGRSADRPELFIDPGPGQNMVIPKAELPVSEPAQFYHHDLPTAPPTEKWTSKNTYSGAEETRQEMP